MTFSSATYARSLSPITVFSRIHTHLFPLTLSIGWCGIVSIYSPICVAWNKRWPSGKNLDCNQKLQCYPDRSSFHFGSLLLTVVEQKPVQNGAVLPYVKLPPRCIRTSRFKTSYPHVFNSLDSVWLLQLNSPDCNAADSERMSVNGDLFA